MDSTITTITTDKRRMIASLDDYTLLGLSKLGEPEERRMALAEIQMRATQTDDSVLGAASRLVRASDQLDALMACEDPADLMFDRSLGEGRR